jgi:hypothetical protein
MRNLHLFDCKKMLHLDYNHAKIDTAGRINETLLYTLTITLNQNSNIKHAKQNLNKRKVAVFENPTTFNFVGLTPLARVEQFNFNQYTHLVLLISKLSKYSKPTYRF